MALPPLELGFTSTPVSGSDGGDSLFDGGGFNVDFSKQVGAASGAAASGPIASLAYDIAKALIVALVGKYIIEKVIK